jgi:tetratricopeptide (TPR) repeat protein
LLLLLFVVLAVYYPAIFAPLNSVDDPGMYEYLLNTDDFSLRRILIPGKSGAYYRPLLDFSFLADKFVWGLEESFMHLENILFHLANTLLLFAIARRVSRQLGIDSPYPMLLAPLFFAIHPLNSESVIWISGRTDLLAGMFILLSTYLLLSQRRTILILLLAALSLLLACLAKDTAIFFLPAALVFPFFQTGEANCRSDETLIRVFRNNLSHFLVFITTGAGYFLFRSLAFSRGDLGTKQVMTHVVGGQGADFLLSLRLVLKAAGFYVKKLFVPFPLNFGIVHVSDLYVIVALVLVAVLLRLFLRRTLNGYFFVAAAAIGSSALLVPLLRMTWTPLAERYMYVPCAFFSLGITFTVYRWTVKHNARHLMLSMVACLAAIAIYGTAQRAILWQENLALFEDCKRKSPDFIPAQNEIAGALYRQGNTEAACRVIKSIKPSADLINSQYLQLSKAAALINEGNIDGARSILRQTLRNPGKLEIKIIQRILKLNELEVQDGKAQYSEVYGDNVSLLSRLYELTGDPFYQYRLGQAHMFAGERSKACDAFQRVISTASPKAYYYPVARKLLEKNLKK